MAIDFGEFKKEPRPPDVKMVPEKKEIRIRDPAVDWQKKYNDLKDQFDTAEQAIVLQKNAIDQITWDLSEAKAEVERLNLKGTTEPPSLGDVMEIAQVINCIHVNANQNQQLLLDDIIGDHGSLEVRKWLSAKFVRDEKK